jgi:hypothetical protein
MVNLVIALKNEGTPMIQLVANQDEMTKLLDFNTQMQTIHFAQNRRKT